MSDDDEFTRGVLDTRRAFASVWASVTGREIHETEFTARRFMAGLQSRWFERRSLADGTAPAVGQRVVVVPEVAKRWGLGHACDDLVHEITSLLGGDCHLVECGARQIGVGMLRLAPPGSEVTCGSCRGWREQLARMRIDSEVYRAAQFEHEQLKARAEKAEAELHRMREQLDEGRR